MGEALLVADGITAGYTRDVPVVRGVDAAFSVGTVTTIVGPNGAGKSTLLRTFAGLTRLLSGRITLSGRRIETLPPWDRLRSGLGFVPQGRCNFPYMTVQENLELGGYLLDRQRARGAREEVLAYFPMLRQRLGALAGNLSGGQQQLLEMAMVLQVRPRVLLVDEPSLGLSPSAQNHVFALLRDVADEGVTVVMVEQNVRGGLAVADAALVMDQGRVVMAGAASAVLEDERIRDVYLGGMVGAPTSVARIA